MSAYDNRSLQNIQGEIWKPCVGYETRYQVSNFGRVKSLPHPIHLAQRGLRERTNRFVMSKERIMKIRVGNSYWRVMFVVKFKHKLFAVHRLMATAFLPNPENKPQVNHKDGNKLNNHLSNLEWVTGKENMKHAVDVLGYSKAGERHHGALLTDMQAREIKIALIGHKAVQGKRNGLINQLSEKYKVRRDVIESIYRNENWTHIQI